MRERDHHVFNGDQVFEANLRLLVDDGRLALVAVFLLHIFQLFHNQAAQDFFIPQDLFIFSNLLLEFIVLFLDFVALQSSQPLQLHFQDGLRLPLRKVKLLHQARAGVCWRLGSPDQLDDGVQMRQRLQEAFQNVGALLGFAKVVTGAPPDDVYAVIDEVLDGLHQRQFARLAVHNGQHNHPEVFLQLSVLVKIVQNDFRLLAALDLNHDAHAFAVRLVPDIGDALDFLVLHQAGNALNHPG